MKKNLDIALMWFTAATIFSLPFFFFDMDFPTAFFEASSALTSVGITSLSKDNPLYFYRVLLSFLGGILFLSTLPHLISTSDSFKFAIRENISEKKIIYTYICLFAFGAILYLIFGENLSNAITLSALTVSTTGSEILPERLIPPAEILMFLSVIFPLLYIYFNFKISITEILKREQFKIFALIFSLSFICLSINNVSENNSIFYILSFSSTTGFITENFSDFGNNHIFLLYLLAVIGGLIGSVGGGIKIFRLVVLFKIFFAELKHTLYPRAVTVIKLNDAPTPPKIIGKVLIFFFLYTSSIFVFTLIFSAFNFDYEDAAAISFSLFTTVGILPAELKESLFHASPLLKIIAAFVFIILRLKIFIFFIVIQSFYEKIITTGVHSWKKQ